MNDKCGRRDTPHGPEVRECAQCGAPFTPRREHARFCSAACRVAWNREHVGVAAAPAVAIDWSVTAMTEAAGRLATARACDLPRVAAAVGETVWWVTLVDATLVRYHPRDYENALAGKTARRQSTEETLEGLRYVRNQLGKSVDPAEFIATANSDHATGCTWRPQPEPALPGLAPRARQWELSRYHSYQARLAGHRIAATFTRCTGFLAHAAILARDSARPSPGVPGLPRPGTSAARPVGPPSVAPPARHQGASNGSARGERPGRPRPAALPASTVVRGPLTGAAHATRTVTLSYRVREPAGLPLTGEPVPQARPGQPTSFLEQVFAEYPERRQMTASWC